MQYVVKVKGSVEGEVPADFSGWAIEKELGYPRGGLPAITHVDGSARVQTVTASRNERLYNLLMEFKNITGIGVLVNTSFNERGKPIVCTPDDAFRTFMYTDMEVLVTDNILLYKKDQTPIT